jgi:hypothetical protein
MQYYNNNSTSHVRIMHLLTTELKFHSTPSVLPGYNRIRWWKQSVDTFYSTCKQRPYLIYKLTNNNKYYISCTFSANYRQLEYECVRAPLAVDPIQLIRFYHVSYFCPVVVANFCYTVSAKYPGQIWFFLQSILVKYESFSIWHDSHDFTMYHNRIYFCPVVTNFCLTASAVYPYNMRLFANGDNPDTKKPKTNKT